MTRVRVPKTCMGIEMESGKKYDASRGIMDVDDRDARHLGKHKLGLAANTPTTGSDIRRIGQTSCECGFVGWPWQTQCPRCGDALSKD